jgi:Immunity protein Imm1
MHAKVLDVVEYADDGVRNRTTKTASPTWAQIEAAIRRLDRFHFPFLFLWPTEDARKHYVDGDCEVFEVMGGEGVYWIAGSLDGYFQRRFLNPEGGDEDVVVWTSDQGFGAADRHICRDVEVVLRAARYYAEHGGFDPSVSWESPGRKGGPGLRAGR